MRSQTYVIGNWKLHGDLVSVKALSAAISTGIESQEKLRVAVCPVSLHLSTVIGALEHSSVAVGGQDCSVHQQGAYTGEVSAEMLADIGCQYTLVGHSERRTLFADSDDIVAAKFQAATGAGLTPVLCVGESLQERQAGSTQVVICQQVQAIIDALGVEALSGALLAYEPCWAIGTGLTATPEQAQEAHEMLRQHIASVDAGVAAQLPLLYGGSVKANNALDILQQADVDGVLVGGASLQAQEFLAICHQAVESYS